MNIVRFSYLLYFWNSSICFVREGLKETDCSEPEILLSAPVFLCWTDKVLVS